MTMEKIEQKARELKTKTRRNLVGNIAFATVASGLYAFAMTQFPEMRVPFTLAIAWTAAGAYFLHRGMRSATLPGDAAWSTGMELYRDEVNQRRMLIRGALWWSFAPAMLAIGTFLVALSKKGDIFRKAMPFMALVAVWVVAYFVIRMREQGKLRREIDELNRIATLSGRP